MSNMYKNIFPWKNRRAFFVACMLFLSAGPAVANSYTWKGGVTGNHWSDNGNWLNNGLAATDYPGQNSNSDIVTITTTGGHNDPILNVSVSIGSLTIAQAASLYNDGIHSITTLGDVIVGPNSGNTTAGLKFCMGTSGADLVIGGNLSGAGNLYLYGTGQIVEIGGDMSINGFMSSHSGHFGSTVVFNGNIAQSINPYKGYYTFDNLEIDNAASGVTNLALNYIEIDGNLAGTGSLMGGGSTLYLVGNLTMMPNTFVKDTSTFILYAGLNAVNSNGRNDWQYVNQQSFYTLVVEDNYARLTGNVTVTHNLDFEGVQVSSYSNIMLSGYNLTVNSGATLRWGGNTGPVSVTTMKQKGYVVTDSTGSMSMAASASGTLWPIGTSNTEFTPLTLTAATTSTIAAVRVKPGITDNTLNPMTGQAVNFEWVVTPQDSSPAEVTLKTSWLHSSDELTTEPMDRSAAYISYRNQETTSPAAWTAIGNSGNPTYNPTGVVGTQDSLSSGIYPLLLTQGSVFFIGMGSDANALPVELLNFTANYQPDAGHVNLAWTTASEIENAYFDIERSADGIEWTAVGKVQGHGTSNVYNHYTAVDNLAGVVPSGIFYYRLKQVDFNGAFKYSDIKSINISQPVAAVSAYPNPVSGILNINMPNAQNGNGIIRILNMNGETLVSEPIAGNGDIHKQIDMSMLAKGTYLLQVITGSGTITNIPVVKN